MSHCPSSVSVVVPVYNSATTLPLLVAQLLDVLAPPATESLEILLVNDASLDSSWSEIARLAAQHSCVRGINLMRNYGQHNALLCGIVRARGEVIVTLDDDLQHPPEEIPKLLRVLDERNVDVVYGTPIREAHGLWRTLASRLTKVALQSAMGAETARKVSAFRVFRANVRRAFEDCRSPFVSIDVLLTWGTTQFTSVDVEHHEREHGTSNYTFVSLIRHALNMMTGFSTMPLQVASIMGFAFTTFGIGVLVYVVGRYIVSGTSVPGFPFLASIIAIFAGAQLFALGVIGEYLARMHFRMMERPPFSVREELD